MLFRSWHADGHPHDGPPPFNRHVWDPECPECGPQAAGRAHYYNHTVDFVEDCPACEQERTWKAEGTP